MAPIIKYSKEKIIEVGLKLVNEKGLESVSARSIAKELGSSICPVFSYFENMDVLKEEILKEVFKFYQAYIQEGMKGSLKPFKDAGIRYIKFAREYRNYFNALFMQKNDSNNVMELMNIDTENNKVMEKNISDDNDINKKVHKYCWLFVHGIAVMEASGYCSFSEEEISEMLTYEYEAIVNKVKGE